MKILYDSIYCLCQKLTKIKYNVALLDRFVKLSKMLSLAIMISSLYSCGVLHSNKKQKSNIVDYCEKWHHRADSLKLSLTEYLFQKGTRIEGKETPIDALTECLSNYGVEYDNYERLGYMDEFEELGNEVVEYRFYNKVLNCYSYVSFYYRNGFIKNSSRSLCGG